MIIKIKKGDAMLLPHKLIILPLLFSLSFPLAVALSIHFTPIISGSPQINSTFSYTMNLTRNSDCTGVILSNTSTVATDARGVAFLNINISGLSEIPNYICEFRNGTLRATMLPTDIVLREIYGGNLKNKETEYQIVKMDKFNFHPAKSFIQSILKK